MDGQWLQPMRGVAQHAAHPACRTALIQLLIPTNPNPIHSRLCGCPVSPARAGSAASRGLAHTTCCSSLCTHKNRCRNFWHTPLTFSGAATAATLSILGRPTERLSSAMPRSCAGSATLRAPRRLLSPARRSQPPCVRRARRLDQRRQGSSCGWKVLAAGPGQLRACRQLACVAHLRAEGLPGEGRGGGANSPQHGPAYCAKCLAQSARQRAVPTLPHAWLGWAEGCKRG